MNAVSVKILFVLIISFRAINAKKNFVLNAVKTL